MASSSDRAPRMDVLVLSTLSRVPMHGYELKLELRYRHVRWWAKCEHGHLYASLSRLHKSGLIRQRKDPTSERRVVYEVTGKGRAYLSRAMKTLALSEDATYFDLDLFLSGAFTLERAEAVKLLEQRAKAIEAQLQEARSLKRSIGRNVPGVASLIMEHRIDHLAREVRFAKRGAKMLAAQKVWGPFLGKRRIGEFLAATKVPIER